VKVLVAMSGGVDSSVAATLLRREGDHVTGVTMRLWGGESDTGCCSVSDVDDARRVAQQLDIDHLVFNFGDDFEQHVVSPYVDAHRGGSTPNPCIECNRRLKFDRLAERARVLGFDALATGHHARVRNADGRWTLRRGADRAKDQSYVVHMLDQRALPRIRFPVGELRDKAEVRRVAAELGLRTATKPDSQDVCFIPTHGGRASFLSRRIPFHPATVIDTAGSTVGTVPIVELVTVGQRRGLGLATAGAGRKRYVVEVDPATATVMVGSDADLLVGRAVVGGVTWVDGPVDGPVLVQCSAHGAAHAARATHAGGDRVDIEWDEPQRRVAPGQSLVFYDTDDDRVLGGGIAQRSPT